MKTEDNKKYLIAVDLDDTILINYQDMSDLTRKVLKHLNDMGHQIIISTGRPFHSSLKYYKELGLQTPIINFNGSFIHNPNNSKFGEVRYEIAPEVILPFINEAKPYLTNAFLETPHHTYMQHKDEAIERDFCFTNIGITYGDFNETTKEHICGGILFCNKENVSNIYEISKKYEPFFKVRNWGGETYDVFELFHPHMHKGQALKLVSKHLNIPPENIIAFGDGLNDIEMLQYAKYSVSFENARHSAKEAAKVITIPHYEDAVAKYLIEFFNLEIK